MQKTEKVLFERRKMGKKCVQIKKILQEHDERRTGCLTSQFINCFSFSVLYGIDRDIQFFSDFLDRLPFFTMISLRRSLKLLMPIHRRRYISSRIDTANSSSVHPIFSISLRTVLEAWIFTTFFFERWIERQFLYTAR